MTRKRSRLVSIKPRLRKRCINRLIRGRVVPTISDSSSCEIFSSMRVSLLVFLAQCARQLQQRPAQALLAVHRHQIGDDLLLSAMRTARYWT